MQNFPEMAAPGLVVEETREAEWRNSDNTTASNSCVTTTETDMPNSCSNMDSTALVEGAYQRVARKAIQIFDEKHFNAQMLNFRRFLDFERIDESGQKAILDLVNTFAYRSDGSLNSSLIANILMITSEKIKNIIKDKIASRIFFHRMS